MNFINRLREKSPTAKKTIAIVTSAVVTLAIFAVWASVLNFGNNPKSKEITASVANSSGASGTSDTKDVNPFSAFWDVISKGWGGLTDNINQIKTGVDGAKDLMNTIGSATSTGVGTGVAGGVDSQPSVQTTPQPATQSDVFILSGESADGGDITQ